MHSASPGLLRALRLLAASLLFALAPALHAADEPRLNVLIAFKSTPGPAEQALVRSHRGEVTRSFTLVPAVAARIPAAAAEGLQRNPHVSAVEVDGLFHAITYETELAATWGVAQVGAGTLHASGATGSGVKVAILDSGIAATHADLAANYAGGWDFVNGDANPLDDNGHGTHVAGTVAAVRNGLGVVGAAPEADLFALKVLGASGSGSFSAIISALEWCVENGISITNNSYGSSQDPGTIVKAAFDNSAAAGILHIAAAGNSGNRAGTGNNVGWPARYDSVVAVAATSKTDARASFSSTGPTVELSAPGVGINSTLLSGGYGTMNGTSMASPHVAGVAALLRGLSPTSSPQAVRSVLQASAVDLGDAGRDNLYGFGLIDAEAAVIALADPGPGEDPPPPDATELVIDSVDSQKTHRKNGSFEITWTTNVPATSVVEFVDGTTGTYSDSNLKTSHRLTFKGTNGTPYSYLVQGTTATGDTATAGPFQHQN